MSVGIIPTLNRKIATAAATEIASDHRSTLFEPGRIEGKQCCSYRDRLVEQRVHSKPDREVEDDAHHGGGDRRESCIECLYASKLLRERCTEENPKKARVNVTQVASSPPSVPAKSGESGPGCRNAAMKPTNCSTMMSGPGVVSAIPRPSSISPGLSQP